MKHNHLKQITDYIKQIPRLVWGIFLFAFIIRFWGIGYGLPLFLNIDEPATVSTALSIKHQVNPGRFDWPHLFFYINAGFIFLYSLVRPVLSLLFGFEDMFYSIQATFVVTRFSSVLFGALTVIPCYLFAKEIFNKHIGYVTAIMVAVLPVHVYESHFAKPDIFITFFTAIALIFIYRISQASNNSKDNLPLHIISGSLIGIITSIKYNGVLLFFPLLIGVYLRNKRFQEFLKLSTIKDLFISGLFSILFFFLGTPFALFDFKTFISMERGKGALWQIQNVGSVPWENYSAEAYETIFSMYMNDLGIFLWTLFILILVLFLFFNKRDKKYILLLLPVVFFSFYISKFKRSPSHYFLFLIPFYCTALSHFLFEISERVQSYLKIKKVNVYWMLSFFILLPSIYGSLRHSYLFSRLDTRTESYAWVQSNLESGVDVLYVQGEDLDYIDYGIRDTVKAKKLNTNFVEHNPPFYVVIGQRGLEKDDILEGKRDPKLLPGNSGPILQEAKVELVLDNKGRLGPPIYIFKVNRIVKD